MYDENKKHKAAKGFDVSITELIEISHGSVWTSDTRSAEAAYFDFINGKQGWFDRSYFVNPVLPVRSAGKGATAKETGRDGRFIAYDNGTVLDTRTKLMWAAEDKYGVNWQDAKRFCETYRGGGYADWRMPTKKELVELYDKTRVSRTAGRDAYLTELIRLTRSTWIWASETRGSDAAYLSFGALVPTPEPEWDPQNDASLSALPVRTAK